MICNSRIQFEIQNGKILLNIALKVFEIQWGGWIIFYIKISKSYSKFVNRKE